MAEPILEQLAQWHLAAVAGITTAAGYHQTLLASRSEEKFLDGESLKDLSVLCALSAAEGAVVKVAEDINREHPTITWDQRFDAFVYLLGRGGSTVPVDRRIARIVGDVHKRMGVERAQLATRRGLICDGLAQWIDLVPWEIVVDEPGVSTVVNVPVRVRYTVHANDPHQQ
jgi:hypothetical protein